MLINNYIEVHFLSIHYIDCNGEKHPLELVVYKFQGVPGHKVVVRPHGNAKSNSPYFRVMKSTKEKLKKELDHLT
jgi:hypothetical protein